VTSVADWNPAQYLRFERDRARPAGELLQRVRIANPQLVVDLGCGAGTTTRLLGARFAGSNIVGIDSSAQMIAKARENYPKADYKNCDLRNWEPAKPVDLIFSNAVFHWLPDHKSLLSKLAGALSPGGELAIQMPANMNEPSHLTIAKVAGRAHWKELLLEPLSFRTALATSGEYYDWLARDYEQIDIWNTRYAHIMPSHAHIVEWVKGAALTPVLSVLDDNQSAEFLEEYTKEITDAYPLQADGRIIYNFPRLFMTAVKHR